MESDTEQVALPGAGQFTVAEDVVDELRLAGVLVPAPEPLESTSRTQDPRREAPCDAPSATGSAAPGRGRRDSHGSRGSHGSRASKGRPSGSEPHGHRDDGERSQPSRTSVHDIEVKVEPRRVTKGRNSQPGGWLASSDMQGDRPAPAKKRRLRRPPKVMRNFLKLSKRVVFPDNKALLYWDLLLLFLILFIVVYVPYQVGVSNGQLIYSRDYAFLFGTFINIVFILDVILNFFRAYYDDRGRMVFNRHKIMRHYLYGWFVVDLLACFPVDMTYRFLSPKVFIDYTGVNLLSIINLLRVFRLNRAFNVFSSNSRLLKVRLKMYEYKSEIWRIVLILFVFSHWIGCMFSFVALLEAGSFLEEDLLNPANPNWLQEYVLGGGPLPVVGNAFENAFARYTLVFYWACTTITSIGYGDITPYTWGETWYVSIVELLSGLLWAWVIGQTINLVEEMNRNKIEFRSRLVELNQLEHHFADEQSRAVANESRQFLYRQNRGAMGTHDGMKITSIAPVLDQLPPRLRNRICLALIRRDLQLTNYLRHSTIDIHTLAGVASLCEIQHFNTGEVMCIEREATERRCLYVLRTGVLAMTRAGEGSLRRHGFYDFTVYCNKGILLHDLVLLPRRSSAIPDLISIGFLTYTEMVAVPRQAIRALFQVHPEAWRDSGRWCALRASLTAWAVKKLGRGGMDETRRRRRFSYEQFRGLDRTSDDDDDGSSNVNTGD
mmetsp:Transcript_10143/g.28690  ORF Transcript_10143/g.28690 Transcript_10143/m.28690 type:complete len:720 (-) Transcript_10143:98-2257(-)